MDREATFLLALGLLIAAAAVVSVTGWIMFVRDRRTDRPKAVGSAPEQEGDASDGVSPTTDRRS